MRYLQPSQAKDLLVAKDEIAFIDVREYGQFGEGHPFFAVNLPYSQLELTVFDLVPLKTSKLLLLDDNDGVAEKAFTRLTTLGYRGVHIVKGGAPAWQDAGFTLFKGVNLPSKSFGELVEHAMNTPSMTVEELQDKRRDGCKLILLDGRSPQEFKTMNIPGALSCPNAELPHRLPMLVDDPDTTIVVNCAGRTRSIIGAQSLRNLRPSNRVFALQNGTQGWCLAGYELERGADPGELPNLDQNALAVSADRAVSLISRFSIPQIDLDILTSWRKDNTRTLYLFDVRTAEEYSDGHLAGASHAPGGQLVQATDQWVAVRGARIVLTDDTGLRAANTALWLRGMGHDVSVLCHDASTCETVTRTQPPTMGHRLPVVAPNVLADRLASKAVLLDLSPGMAYREAHIENAIWATRARLDSLNISADHDIILACRTPGVAELAAVDLRERGHMRLSRLDGTPDDWRKAGLTVVASPDRPGEKDCIDFLFFVHSRHEGDLEASRRYLEWEVNLLKQIDTQELSTLNPPAL
ncbi:MAG: sulfurtransferase [Gammaproteobacteria bacterium]|nr:sulfurtransferase [Gammaproteobacteria bacterium]